MAAYHGKQGSVTFVAAQNVDQLVSWSIDATADTTEVTVMVDSAVGAATHWKEYLPTFKDWTGTCEAYLDSTGLDPDLAVDFIDDDGGTAIFFQGFTGESGRKYTGNAIVTGISAAADKDGVITVTYTFQGSGALTVAVDS